MQDASRVERLWLAMAVALVWTVCLGSQADSQLPVAHIERLPPAHIAHQRVKGEPGQRPVRRLSCPQRGRLVLLAAVVRAEDWPMGPIIVEPWPEKVTPRVSRGFHNQGATAGPKAGPQTPVQGLTTEKASCLTLDYSRTLYQGRG